MSSPSPSGARRGRPGHDRPAVLAAAIELFNRKGYDATSVGDIATSLNVTKSAVYHHVASKEQLLAEALDEALAELEATVRAAASTEGAAYARLQSVIRRSVEVLVEHQPAVTLLLRVHGNSETERTALRRRRLVDVELARLVAQAVTEGDLRDDLEPDLVSRLMFGMINSLVEWYRPGRSVPVDVLTDTLSTLVLDGLSAERSVPGGPRAATPRTTAATTAATSDSE